MTEAESQSPAPSAGRNAQRSALAMAVFAVVCTAMMALTQWLTAPAIEASRYQERMQVLQALLPTGSYDNDVVQDAISLGPTPALGLRHGGRVYRARLGTQPAALIVEAHAPDGYAGEIQLLVGVRADGRLTGVRVTAHKETPGLGDYIDIRKDRRSPPWMSQFTNLSFAQLEMSKWKPRREGGGFDDVTGATLSARAVIRASAAALAFILHHEELLYTTPTGERLDGLLAPDAAEPPRPAGASLAPQPGSTA